MCDTWSEGITVDELEPFVWLKPMLKATVEYQEWKSSNLVFPEVKMWVLRLWRINLPFTSMRA